LVILENIIEKTEGTNLFVTVDNWLAKITVELKSAHCYFYAMARDMAWYLQRDLVFDE